MRAEHLQRAGMDRLMESILAYAGGSGEVAPILLRCKVIELLAAIHDTVDAQAPSESAPHIENELVLEILQYLNTHYLEELSLSDVAACVYHSKYYVCHLFKEYIGISMHDYIVLRRIHLVNDRIRQGHSISNACYSAGFHNYSNFFRLYKKHTGMTPHQFKSSLEK